MEKIKSKTEKTTIADVISQAYGELEALAQEAREIVDNATEGLQQTQRIQTFESTADELESISEATVPEAVASIEIEYPVWQNARKGRGLSRADRCSWACALLDCVVDALSEKGDIEEIAEFTDTLESDKSSVEGGEFPGMYG